MNISSNNTKPGAGFTIVELLIVVVVIAILAAITIVAFNGIKNRAVDSAAQSNASTTAKKLATYMIENGDTLPADTSALVALGLTTSGTTYEYTVDHVAKTYCATITTQNKSYKIANGQSTPATGACVGHSLNGVAQVTNLATNPSFEAATPVFTGPNSTAITYSTTRFVSGARSGLVTMPMGNSSNYGIVLFRDTNVGTILKPNTTYTASASVYVPTGTVTVGIALQSSGVESGSSSDNIERSTTLKNQWVRLWRSFRTNGVGSGQVTAYILNNANTTTAGTQFWVDNIMMTEGGTPPAYADGNSAGWIWNGAVDSATSTGPPL